MKDFIKSRVYCPLNTKHIKSFELKSEEWRSNQNLLVNNTKGEEETKQRTIDYSEEEFNQSLERVERIEAIISKLYQV